MNPKWNERFMRLAREIATWSLDPSRKIGAVAVDETRRILSTGYNGFPMGVEDSPERLNDRETKYKYTVHAEANVIYSACNNGVSLKNSYLYVWGLPVCSDCAKGVIQVGVKKVFCGFDDGNVYQNSIWKKSFETTTSMFKEAGVEVDVIRLPEPMVSQWTTING